MRTALGRWRLAPKGCWSRTHFPETSAQIVGKKRCLRWRTHPRKHAPRPAKLAKRTWLSLQFLCRRQWEHFPQTSPQIVGNKGQPEAEVCGARDVPGRDRLLLLRAAS